MEIKNRLRCGVCGKQPSEISGYVDSAECEGMSPEEWVRQEEGTLNKETGLFACDPCYITLGSPASPRGWKFGDAL